MLLNRKFKKKYGEIEFFGYWKFEKSVLFTFFDFHEFFSTSKIHEMFWTFVYIFEAIHEFKNLFCFDFTSF